jgi:dienelactone hydrolase
MRLLLPLALVLALAGCARDAPQKYVPVEDDLAGRFAYAVGTAEVEEGERQVRDGIARAKVTITLPDGVEIPGYVVREAAPVDDDPAGIVFAHGARGGADDFLNEAHELARRGAVVLATDSPFVRSDDEALREGQASLQDTYDAMVQWVREVRIAVDVLVDRYGADPARLGAIGYSMGAQPATIAAALDPRMRALVVMAGQAYPSGLPDDLLARRLFTAIDTAGFVDNLAPTKLLIQAAEYDSIHAHRESEILAEQASEPVEIRWYEADHELGQRAAVERVEWLVDVLGLR